MNEQYYDAVLNIKTVGEQKGLTSLCTITVMNRRHIAD